MYSILKHGFKHEFKWSSINASSEFSVIISTEKWITYISSVFSRYYSTKSKHAAIFIFRTTNKINIQTLYSSCPFQSVSNHHYYSLVHYISLYINSTFNEICQKKPNRPINITFGHQQVGPCQQNMFRSLYQDMYIWWRLLVFTHIRQRQPLWYIL